MKACRSLLATSICLALGCYSAASVRLRAREVPREDFSNDRRAEKAEMRRGIKEGIKDARKELAAGRLALEISGLPSPYRWKYFAALEARGIKPRVVAGCIVDARTLGHEWGFNQTMAKEIARRHGKDFLERLDKEEELARKAEQEPIVPFDAVSAAEAFR